MSLRPGMVLDHRYELLQRLGEGGQGSVWRAHDRSTGEDRALKIVQLPAQNREALDRARREARLVQDARHPALVRCHSLVEIPGDDIVVLVFDFVEATSLAEAMSDSRFERMHRLAVLRHTAQALAFLHERGIVHRDIKPDNVLLTSVFYEDVAAPDAIRIIDFGIAAPQEGAGGTTLSGRFGTPAYMAPELFEIVGVDSQRSAARDVYAFGVMAWELLHGGHPTRVPIRSGAGVFSALYASLRPGREPWPPKSWTDVGALSWTPVSRSIPPGARPTGEPFSRGWGADPRRPCLARCRRVMPLEQALCAQRDCGPCPPCRRWRSGLIRSRQRDRGARCSPDLRTSRRRLSSREPRCLGGGRRW
ncbi:MAG: protein kinase [Polyangiaceae bacterium]